MSFSLPPLYEPINPIIELERSRGHKSPLTTSGGPSARPVRGSVEDRERISFASGGGAITLVIGFLSLKLCTLTLR